MMARPATGTIMERPTKGGRINRTLRFYAGGKRRTVPLGPVSRAEAERQLAYVTVDVERGTWQPPVPIEQPTDAPIKAHEAALPPENPARPGRFERPTSRSGGERSIR